MTDLIEKLQGLTGPDREVDALIWLEFTPGATRKQWSYIHTATGRECHVDETRDATDRLIIVPEYTASLDAAIALAERMLPDALWDVGKGGVAKLLPNIFSSRIEVVAAATPAIALCIALLRALEARDAG